MQIKIQPFLDKYRQISLHSPRIKPLTPKTESALIQLLSFINSDSMFGNTHTDLRKLAYVLATILHECAGTWAPIEEFGKGRGRSYGKADPFTGKTYYGRGYVQLTWKTNYQTMGAVIGVDLVNRPERACEPSIAWKICSEGMRKGRFTGKRLRDYITDTSTNYKGARKIINGTDQADLIAWYATKFQAMIEAAI